MKDQFNEQISPDRTANVEALCQVFNASGFECWLVGGSVRDLMMGKEPKDFDFASNAPLEEVKQMFKKVIPTGEDHGTLTVQVGGEFFEVTRFRLDVATDGRRATVEFSDSIEEDLARRDFTVNAIAFDPLSGKVVDPFNGMEDLKAKRLRFVGDLEERIKEDHLRALRFVRFQAGEFGLKASEEDFEKVVSIFDESILSQERINDEVGKIFGKLNGGSNAGIDVMLLKLGVFKRFFQGQDGEELWNKAVNQMMDVKHMFPMAVHVARFNKSPKAISSLLKLSSEMKDHFQLFEKMGDFNFQKRSHIKMFLNEIFKSGIKNRLDVEILFGQLIEFKGKMGELEMSKAMDALDLSDKIANANEPFAISHLKVNGDDLKELEFEGQEIGAALNSILHSVWEDPKLNSGSFKANVKLWKLIERIP